MRSLRSKMTQIAFVALLVVFVLMSMIINLSLSIHNTIQSDDITRLISDNGGRMPRFVVHNRDDDDDSDDVFPWGYNEESPFKTRYFIVNLQDGAVSSTDISHIAAVSEETAYKMAEKAIEQDRETGYVDEYRFRITENDGESYIIFLDCYENFRNRRVVLLIMLAIFIGFTALITVIFGICSKYVLKPFEENSKRQKQFVTDASHELKTPLAIISANAEVLEYKTGANKWTKTITDEVEHMSRLINQLLTLAKLEETNFALEKEQVDLSALAKETIGKFTEIAASKNAEINADIQPDIQFRCSREQLTQLISVLTENASKYVTDGGRIDIKLWSKGRKVFFSVFNTAELDENENYSRLFDRFYRSDRSRSSKTGGHGIGLSIAKHICVIYGGDIKAVPKDGGLEFCVTLVNSR